MKASEYIAINKQKVENSIANFFKDKSRNSVEHNLSNFLNPNINVCDWIDPTCLHCDKLGDLKIQGAWICLKHVKQYYPEDFEQYQIEQHIDEEIL